MFKWLKRYYNDFKIYNSLKYSNNCKHCEERFVAKLGLDRHKTTDTEGK